MSDRTRTRLLNALKASGPQTAADLSTGLDVTPVAVRQHLDGLLAEDLVEFEDVKGGVGRPKRVWSLSPEGHARFPDNHSVLILGLLEGMKDLFGQEGVDRLIAHRQEAAHQAYSKELERATSLGQRLEILAELRSREGYMASVEEEDEGGYLLIENHCSICAAATACQGFCHSEMLLFQELLGPDVTLTRAEHLLSGGRRCVYRIQEAR
ncbi:metalloregulator ArsR/SmtB family transcription factor [uncultured Roseibium sp.]|uniref:helix-turn-helix transcriptional regulator n=1 Tax=uncultured Roseibium sp. TaxID=1936171 RepID=UPI0032179395